MIGIHEKDQEGLALLLLRDDLPVNQKDRFNRAPLYHLVESDDDRSFSMFKSLLETEDLDLFPHGGGHELLFVALINGSDLG